MSRLLLLLAPALAAAASCVRRGTCGDNCARAVIASAHTTRHGAADCSAYLHTTVTQPTSTITETSTLSSTPTVTLDVTETDTATTVLHDEVTSTVESVVTSTVYTSTTTMYSNWPGLVSTLKKRDETPEPTIPAYASPCSGAVRYSTACACVGVFPTTITVSEGVATSTVYVSNTATVTDLATVTDVVTATTTDLFTVTSITTTTVSAVATSGVPAFRLQVDGNYIGLGSATFFPSINGDLLPYVTDKSDSALFTLDTETNTLYNVDTGYTLHTSAPVLDPMNVVLFDPEEGSIYYALTCSVSNSTGALLLSCGRDDIPDKTHWTYDSHLDLASSSELTSLGRTALTVRLVAI